jgi:hypothetical protein
MSYRAFTSTWWKEAEVKGVWPNDLEPSAGGPKRTLGKFIEKAAARARCQDYNATHSPGRYGVKAEYEEVL